MDWIILNISIGNDLAPRKVRNSWNIACTILVTKGIDDIVRGQNT